MFSHLVLKVCILVLYLMVVILLFRFLDTIAWYETGLLATQLVDPLSLSVRKLKSLLDTRGLGYEGVVEKEELVKLVQNSGDVVNGEVSLLEKTNEIDDEKKATDFSSGAHFLEEVEDKKDSVWLVQVIPGAEEPLLKNNVWNSVIKRVRKFGIQTGVFTCARDIRFCRRKGWHKPFILLAMPEGHNQKDQLITKHLYTSKTTPDLLQWINNELSTSIDIIENHKDLCDKWVYNKDKASPVVKVVLFSEKQDLSLFHSVVSLKYSGRVKFGIYSNLDSDISCPKIEIKKKSQVLILSPEDIWIYGTKPGEYFNVNALDLLLGSLSPEVNDLFILSFAIVNIMCFMDLFLVSGGIAKVVVVFVWHLIKYNCYFILLWLPLQWLFQASFLAPFSDFSSGVIRSMNKGWLASLLRQDWLHHSSHHACFVALFCVICFVIGWIQKKLRPEVREDSLSSLEWIKLIWHQYYLFLLRPNNTYSAPSLTTNQLEEGIDMIVNHLAAPDLWLHPVISGEYISNLHQWKYGGLPEKELDEGCFERLCSCCKENLVRFNCFRNVDDNDRFDKTCANIQQLFDENDCTSEQPTGSTFSAKHIENLSFERSIQKDTAATPSCISERDNLDSCENCKKIRNSCNYSDLNLTTETISSVSAMCTKCLKSVESSPVRNSKDDFKAEVKDLVTICDTCNNQDPSRHEPKRSKVIISEGCDPWPAEMLESAECSICLEPYQVGTVLCGLPCGHAYHHTCVNVWLTSGKHCCPTCRWPAFKRKAPKLSKYKE